MYVIGVYSNILRDGARVNLFLRRSFVAEK